MFEEALDTGVEQLPVRLMLAVVWWQLLVALPHIARGGWGLRWRGLFG
ncbi:MAG: hypothetical protein IPM88_08650 [Nitrospira sp.]|nr:hypothetical protein [Nitrospira sp.]